MKGEPLFSYPAPAVQVGTGETEWNCSADDDGIDKQAQHAGIKCELYFLISCHRHFFPSVSSFPAVDQKSVHVPPAMHINNTHHIARACVRFPHNLEPPRPPAAAAAAALRGSA